MVVLALIHSFLLTWILIKLKRDMYKPYSGMLAGFTESQFQVDSTVTLQVIVGNQSHIKTMKVDFLIIATHSNTYNIILGRPSLNKVGTIISMPHLLMKFPIS